MASNQAKPLTAAMVTALLKRVHQNHYTARDEVILLLSYEAGLQAGEIANLTWPMVLNSNGRINSVIALHNTSTNKLSGRIIPISSEVNRTLKWLHMTQKRRREGYVIWSGNRQPANAASNIKRKLMNLI